MFKVNIKFKLIKFWLNSLLWLSEFSPIARKDVEIEFALLISLFTLYWSIHYSFRHSIRIGIRVVVTIVMVELAIQVGVGVHRSND